MIINEGSVASAAKAKKDADQLKQQVKKLTQQVVAAAGSSGAAAQQMLTTMVVQGQMTSTIFSGSEGWQLKGDGSATFQSITAPLGAATVYVTASDASGASKKKGNYACDGTDDDLQIQAAIDVLPAVGGKVVLSEGNFSISAQLDWKNYVWIEGQGRNTTTIKWAGGTAATMVGNSTNKPILGGGLSGVTLDADSVANVVPLSLTGAQFLRVKNLLIKNCVQKYGIELNGHTSGGLDNVGNVLSNHFEDIVFHTVYGMVKLNGAAASNGVITLNHFANLQGFYVTTVGVQCAQYCDTNKFYNTLIYVSTNGAYGVVYNATSATVDYNVYGNDFFGLGIYVPSATGVTGIYFNRSRYNFIYDYFPDMDYVTCTRFTDAGADSYYIQEVRNNLNQIYEYRKAYSVEGGTVFNDLGADADLRIEGDTATSLLVIDAGLDAAQIGTTTAGAIADFRAASIIFNEPGGDMDFRVEGDTATSLFVLDAGLDAVQIGTTTAGAIADFRAAETVFNDGGLSTLDFRVEGDTDANLIFADASADKVGIGLVAPANGKLEITASGIHALNLNNDTGVGLQLINTTGEGTGSGANVWMVAGLTPSAADKRLSILVSRAITTGTTQKTGGKIEVYSGEAWDSTHAGGYMTFSVTPTATVSPAESFRIQMDGTLKLTNAAHWTANGTNTVTISDVAPAGVGTATIGKWLTVTDNAGVVYYVPAWT